MFLNRFFRTAQKLGQDPLFLALSSLFAGIVWMTFFHHQQSQEELLFQTKHQQFFSPTELYLAEIERGVILNQQHCQEAELFYQTEKELSQYQEKYALEYEQIWKEIIFPARDSLSRLLNHYPASAWKNEFTDVNIKITKLEQLAQIFLKTVQEKRPQSFLGIGRGLRNKAKAPPVRAFLELRERVDLQLDPLSKELLKLNEDIKELNKIYQSEILLAHQNSLVYWSSLYWLSALLTLVLPLFLIFNYRRKLKVEQAQIQEFSQSLSQGDFPAKFSSRSTPLSPIKSSLNQLRNNYWNFSQAILSDQKEGAKLHSGKNFKADSQLNQALKQIRQTWENNLQESERQVWSNEGLAKFTEIISQNLDSPQKLAERIVQTISEFLEINQAGFFLVEGEGPAARLVLKATYAYNRQKALEKSIPLGEGLLGQTWQEGEKNYLEKIPPNYVQITSGLGEATPSSLLILPIKNNKNTLGILEMASLQKIPAYKIRFAEKIADNLGQALASTQNNTRNRRLLEESQELTQDLQSKEEQMRESMQELQNTQELMSRTQKELADQEANLNALINNTSHAILAYDQDYTITVVNRVARQLYRDLRVGMNLWEALPLEEKEEFESEYQKALEGKKFEAQRSLTQGSKTAYHERNYNPIINEDKEVIGASIFIEDITEQKIQNDRLKEAQANLSSLINDTEDMIMALDKDYQLIVFNEVCEEEYRQKGQEIQLGKCIFDYMTSKEVKRWKEFYDRTLSGARFSQVISNGRYPNKTFREHWFNPIKDESERITGLSIFSRDITESKNSEMKVRQLLLESLEATDSLKKQEEEMRAKMEEYEKKIEELETQS